MIRSMTGRGDASTDAHGVHYFVDIRSLNNKYFKAGLRLPEELQSLEPVIDVALRRRLTRGTITLVVKTSAVGEAAAMTIDHAALDRYIEQIQDSPHIGGGQVGYDAGWLLQLPGVLRPPTDDEALIERSRPVVLELLDRACDRVLEMRRREGEALAADLGRNLGVIRARLSAIEAAAPKMVADYQTRLRTRIESMLADMHAGVEPPDLVREVAAYAERTDIAEEVTRLSTHLDQFEARLATSDDRSIGRTLDFLAQEMLREANTIASKAPDAGIASEIVEVKGAIDRIKEQVQNVE